MAIQASTDDDAVVNYAALDVYTLHYRADAIPEGGLEQHFEDSGLEFIVTPCILGGRSSNVAYSYQLKNNGGDCSVVLVPIYSRRSIYEPAPFLFVAAYFFGTSEAGIKSALERLIKVSATSGFVREDSLSAQMRSTFLHESSKGL